MARLLPVQLPTRKKRLLNLVLVTLAIICISISLPHGSGVAAVLQSTMPGLELPAVLREALRDIDKLEALVDRLGIVPDFGQRANLVVQQAVGHVEHPEHVEKVLDARLQVAFRRQLQTLRIRAADRYEAMVAARPNPLEASWEALRTFAEGATGLVRPDSNWSFEQEHQDLLAWLARSHSQDMELVDELGKQGRSKPVTMEVIKKLQQQSAAVQKEVDAGGALPWDVKWQYLVDDSPLGFRGQYAQGRSVVELLLTPSADPRLKKHVLNRVGPLNLAVAFDMLT